jgi:hypothetical protein
MTSVFRPIETKALALTTTAARMTLPRSARGGVEQMRVFVVQSDAAAVCFIAFNVDGAGEPLAVIPSAGGAAVSGVPLSVSSPESFGVINETRISAVLSAGTGTLYVTRGEGE